MSMPLPAAWVVSRVIGRVGKFTGAAVGAAGFVGATVGAAGAA